MLVRFAVSGRARWPLVFALLLCACFAQPVLAEPSVGGGFPEESPPDTQEVIEAVEAAESEELAREEWLASAEAIARREESHTAFDDLSAVEAKNLLNSTFVEELSRLDADPGRLLSDLRIEETRGAYGVLAEGSEGNSFLVESPIPVHSPLSGQGQEPIDLSLESSGQGFTAETPATAIELPGTSGAEVELGGDIAIADLPGAAGISAIRSGDKDLFFADTDTDSDTFIAPLGGGVEVFEQLRSPQSPEQFRFELSLPPGATLRSDGQAGAEVIDSSGERMASIPAPSAVDAQGSEVPATLEVEGDAVLIDIPHRSAEVAYPVLLDPEFVVNSWYWNGGDYTGLTSWVWDETADYENSYGCIVACWGTGLYARSKGSNHWYGPKTYGQWVFTAANTTAYVSRTVFWTLRGDVSNCPTNQPHGWVGIYNVNSGSYVNQGVYSPPSFSASSHDTGWVGGVGARKAVVGIGTGNGSSQLACGHDFYVGGATIYEDDPENPMVNAVSGMPSGWIGAGPAFTINTNTSDPGLGVRRITLTRSGQPPMERPVGCSGTAQSRCPENRSESFNLSGLSFDEGRKTASIAVEDATARGSTYTWQTQVDRTPPEVTLAGQLAVATEEDEGDAQDPEKWDALPLPAYNLKIEALDGSLSSDATKRSGVKSIEVFLDAKATPEKTWSQTCPASSCPMTQTYQLNLSALSARTHHALKVVVKDQVGNVRERNIEFEYFPATGIKDSYVMHHFPLDDGQGDEAEELHPTRPELAVNVVNGNLVYREQDIDIEGPAVDLEVERYYNSQLPESEDTEWGDGWTLAQIPDLEPIDTGGSPAPDEAELLEASGAIEEGVELPDEAGAQEFDPTLQATLEKKASGGYELVDETGESATTVAFDETGRTEALLTEGYAKVDYTYEGGELAEIAVQDPGSAGSPTEPTEDEESPEPGPYTGVIYAEAFGEEGSAPGQLKLPADVAVDAAGDLWVIDRENARVQKFSPEGEYLDGFGSQGTANGQFTWPSGIAIDPEGNILVTDSANHRVQKFNSKGEFLLKFGSYGTANGQFNGPAGIAISPAGNAIFITDRGNHRIQRFTKEGAYVGKVGSYGWEDAHFDEPLALAIGAPSGEFTYTVFVIDGANNRVQRFTPLGGFLGKFGSYGTGDGRLDSPANIEIDAKGNVWVGDRRNARVQLFDQQGTYIDQFGAKGTEEGQFDLAYPMGIASDGAGGIWVTDGNHNRLQKWVAGSYVPDEAEELPEDDPALEVETPEGLVSSVEGEEAGQHTYSHTGDLLTAYEGPEGETKYEYDSSGRMTEVTLASGTWAGIEYGASGRVGAVTVAALGANPQTTYFGYATEPHQTAVVPPDAPAVTYDIGEDGSVFKWWNTEEPPQFDDVSGTLYDVEAKETANPIAVGGYNLVVQAHSEEGIASIQFVANGDVLVDEIECDKPQVIECKTLINEWVTETGAHAPGILTLEVIATDRLGNTESERFWVNIPYTPPPELGALTPPRFKDIKRFREEYGLEVVFPVANELELNDRIFDLINAWHEPNTPAGEVARSSWERWGVPLRPADVAELEYRDRYIDVNVELVENWAGTNYPGTYAGYYVNHSGGGTLHVGFTQNQSSRLSDLKSQLPLMGPDRLAVYPTVPSTPRVSLVSAYETIDAALEVNATFRSQVTEFSIGESGNSLSIGTISVPQTQAIVAELIGSQVPVNIYPGAVRVLASGRHRATGRMRAGDRILNAKTECTAAFGASEERKQKGNGEKIKARFVLTAGHCFGLNDHVHRSDRADFEESENWTPVGQVTRKSLHGSQATDGLAIRTKIPNLAPRGIFGSEGNLIPTNSAVNARVGNTLCYSGAKLDGVSCGEVTRISMAWEGGLRIGEYNVRFNRRVDNGDSGAPVWNPRTGSAVGVVSAFYGGTQISTVAPLLHPKGLSLSRVPGILHHPDMFDIHLVTGD